MNAGKNQSVDYTHARTQEFSWSEQHRMECEARFILRMPLAERRMWLTELARVRGNVDALKAEIIRQHGKLRADKLQAEIKRQKREAP